MTGYQPIKAAHQKKKKNDTNKTRKTEKEREKTTKYIVIIK